MSTEVLFSPIQLGRIELRSRIVMAPNAPLRGADQATFYSAGEKGYTDYPAEG
jgi:2,4-dienoyl-CoA reductase-like NADH-dependent reductase (Old Yellow Enzyme family)